MSDDLIAPLARILLRYVGGALIAHGVLHDQSVLADADIIQILTVLLGLVCTVTTEIWWFVARKRGWRRD